MLTFFLITCNLFIIKHVQLFTSLRYVGRKEGRKEVQTAMTFLQMQKYDHRVTSYINHTPELLCQRCSRWNGADAERECLLAVRICVRGESSLGRRLIGSIVRSCLCIFESYQILASIRMGLPVRSCLPCTTDSLFLGYPKLLRCHLSQTAKNLRGHNRR